MSFFLLLNTKENILKNVVNQLTVAIDFHISKKILWKSMATMLTVWLPTSFKISSFVFNRRKKLIQVWSKMRVSKFSVLGEPSL